MKKTEVLTLETLAEATLSPAARTGSGNSSTGPRLVNAVVAARVEDGYRLSLEGAEAVAKRAASCLVEPESGDLVLASLPRGGEGHVLAVLERREGTPVRLSVEGATSVSVAGPTLALEAEDLQLKGRRTSLVGEEVTLVGRAWKLFMESVETVAQRVTLRADHRSESLGSSTRRVEGVDSTIAENSVHEVKQTLSIQAEHALVTTRGDMRLDGKRINMG